jgi:uncharacterized membrane-anchored protein YhcB (DUF1043 family)
MRRLNILTGIILLGIWGVITFQIFKAGVRYLSKYPTFMDTGWAIVLGVLALNLYFIYVFEAQISIRPFKFKNFWKASMFLCFILFGVIVSGIITLESLKLDKDTTDVKTYEIKREESIKYLEGQKKDLTKGMEDIAELIDKLNSSKADIQKRKIADLKLCPPRKPKQDSTQYTTCVEAINLRVSSEIAAIDSQISSTIVEKGEKSKKLSEISSDLGKILAEDTTKKNSVDMSTFDMSLAFLPDILSPPLFWLIVGIFSGNLLIFKKMHTTSTPSEQRMLSILDHVQDKTKDKKDVLKGMKVSARKELLKNDLANSDVITDPNGRLVFTEIGKAYKLDRRTVGNIVETSYKEGNKYLKYTVVGTTASYYLTKTPYEGLKESCKKGLTLVK